MTHPDPYLNRWSLGLGTWLSVVLFIVIFAETGLVVTPFLPSDSLMFAISALCSLDNSALRIELAISLLMLAAMPGEPVNCTVGFRVGPRVFRSESCRWLNRQPA